MSGLIRRMVSYSIVATISGLLFSAVVESEQSVLECANIYTKTTTNNNSINIVAAGICRASEALGIESIEWHKRNVFERDLNLNLMSLNRKSADRLLQMVGCRVTEVVCSQVVDPM